MLPISYVLQHPQTSKTLCYILNSVDTSVVPHTQPVGVISPSSAIDSLIRYVWMHINTDEPHRWTGQP